MTIKCDIIEWKVDLMQKDLSGALEIRLPCHCHMIFNSEILHPTNPCSHEYSQPPEIRQILPPQFLKEEFLLTPQTNVTLKSFDLQFLNEESKNEQSAQTQERQPPQQQPRDESNKRPTQEEPHLGILWTLVIFQLVLITFIIVFGVYRYSKYKKEMTYSKERLVYNIYASPSDSNIPESTSNGSSGAYKVNSVTPIPDYMNHV